MIISLNVIKKLFVVKTCVFVREGKDSWKHYGDDF